MLEYLKKHFNPHEMEVIPGISSYQYLMAKIKKTWHNSFVSSVHGRELDIVSIVGKYKSIILLTDNKNSPSRIAETLMNQGMENVKMIVGENLSYGNERIIIDFPKEIVKMEEIGMSVVVIENYE